MERKLKQASIAASEAEIYRRVFYSSPDFVAISRFSDGVYIDVNPSFERFTGYRREEVIGRTSIELGIFADPEERIRYVEAVSRHGELHDYPMRLRYHDGQLRMVETAASLVGIEGEQLMITVVRDMTERHHTAAELQQYREHLEVLVQNRTAELREANTQLIKTNQRLEQAHQRLLETEKRIRHMALHDSLTGLPNRALLHDRIAQAISQAERGSRRMALLFIDLDNFKHINDSLGHMVGDELLRMVASRVKRNLRKSDTFARLGGDEFVICLTGLEQAEQAALLAQKTLQSLDSPFEVKGMQLHAGASIGISLYPDDGTDAETLMQAADTSMYHAKSKGRGNYQFFTPALNAAVQRRLLMESQLHAALPRNEFILHYQPQVDIRSGRILSAEALVRWQQPTRGLVSPLDFIPLAEETGLILRIGEWVLQEACRQLSRWRADGHIDMSIAVNLSARQILQPGFADQVAGILEQNRLPASALELEITESVLMEPSDENIDTLERLTAMGVRLSIDDFGTGYSSLAYLKRFPIHALKIDRSFVRGITADASDMEIVSTIIAMAKNLHLAVIAEGVETPAQAQFLLAHHCMRAQGFHYGRPMDATQLAQAMAAQRVGATGS